MASKVKIRRGFLSDLNPDLQTKIMKINKIIADTTRDYLKNEDKFKDLEDSKWAMSCVDEFCAAPSGKSDIGSVRVYKSKDTYRCEIQVTGRFKNYDYGYIEELLDGLMKNVIIAVRPKVRREFDMTLRNNGDKTSPDEGFDVVLSNRESKEIWDSFDDKKIKTITESVDPMASVLDDWHPVDYTDKYGSEIEDKFVSILPKDLSKYVDNSGEMIELSSIASGYIEEMNKMDKYSMLLNNTRGAFQWFIKILTKDPVRLYIENDPDTNSEFGIIYVLHNPIDGVYSFEDLLNILADYISDDLNNPSLKEWIGNIESLNKLFKEYIHDLAARMKSNDNNRYAKYVSVLSNMDDMHDTVNVGAYLPADVSMELFNKIRSKTFQESGDNTPAYNVDMSEKQAKATLRTLSQDIVNKTAAKKGYKITQYTANIYANIITKNLLPIWAKGFRKFSITLDSYQSFPTFEFRVPKMTQDFVSRFIDGKESINGFIHREPEIRVKMSPHIFHTMKNPDDAFTFFKLAIQYYDFKLDKMSVSLMAEIMKLGYGMKHLIRTTKLSGLVTYPIQMLFVFDNVNMSNKDTFRISKEDIAAVNKFVRGIATNYASPEKEKSKIIEDVKKMVESLHEACEYKDNTSDTRYLPEAIQKYYNGEYNELLEEAKNNFEYENTDLDWERGQENYELRQFQEKFGVKKLKKIPADLVAYITIEAEAIKDANDKMMISSYCLSKIEIVEWYIELLTVGSKKYVVPHTKPYLENVRTQLLACFKKIMDTPVPKSNGNRPIIDIQYPAGYEG